MKRLLTGSIAAAAVATTLSACAASIPDFRPEHAAAIEDSVHAALQIFADAQVEGDWERMSAFYSSNADFIWLEDGKTAYESADAVSAALKALGSSMSAAELVLIEPSIVPLAPGLAALSTGFEQSFTMTDGFSFAYQGAISAVLANGPDGWQFLQGHSSSSSPRPPDQTQSGGR